MTTLQLIRARRPIARFVGLTLVAACGGEARRLPTEQPAASIASVAVRLSRSTIQPLEIDAATLELFDANNQLLKWNPTVVWESSDTSVVGVIGAGTSVRLEARALGSATVTARFDGWVATAGVGVAWNPATRLLITTPSKMTLGERLQMSASTGPIVPPERTSWVSSNDQVVRVDPMGWLIATGTGTASVTASFAGLSASAVVAVHERGVGFGYMYVSPSPDLVSSYMYDIFSWAPDWTEGFSTSGTVSGTMFFPYGVVPDFGWVGPSHVVDDIAVYAVSIEGARCGAALQPILNSTFVVAGAPTAGCAFVDRSPGANVASRFELIAFRTGEFDGALALVRPEGPPLSTRGGVLESVVDGARAFEISGVAGDSVYWFVTPDREFAARCGIAPQQGTAVVAVHCSDTRVPDLRTFHAVAFGADARRGAEPIGFVELDGQGAVKRKATSRLDIEALPAAGVRDVRIAITGPALASFLRVPAVMVTAIADGAASCSLSGPPRGGGTNRVIVDLRCDPEVRGATVGVIY
jgi:hypothetical protein